MLVTRKINSPNQPLLELQGYTLQNVKSHKLLGFTLQWTGHISDIVSKSEKKY